MVALKSAGIAAASALVGLLAAVIYPLLAFAVVLPLMMRERLREETASDIDKREALMSVPEGMHAAYASVFILTTLSITTFWSWGRAPYGAVDSSRFVLINAGEAIAPSILATLVVMQGVAGFMIGYESTRRMVHNWLVQPVIDKNIAKGVAQGKAQGIAEGEARGKAQGIAEGEARGKAESDAIWLDYIARMKESYEKGEPFDEPTPAELRKNGNSQE